MLFHRDLFITIQVLYCHFFYCGRCCMLIRSLFCNPFLLLKLSIYKCHICRCNRRIILTREGSKKDFIGCIGKGRFACFGLFSRLWVDFLRCIGMNFIWFSNFFYFFFFFLWLKISNYLRVFFFFFFTYFIKLSFKMLWSKLTL